MADAVPVRVDIAVGANIEPERNITAGLMLLAKRVDIRAVSTFYRTPAIGHAEQDDYLNGVIAIETVLSAHALKSDFLRDVEQATGRRRSTDAYAARPLDLDILLYGEHVIDDGEIEIPDPDITLRPFLAAGLLELNPSLKLPGDGRRLVERIDPGVIAALKKEDAFTRELKESLTHES